MQTPALLLFPAIKLGSAEKARSLCLHQAVPGDFGLETTALGHPKASASPLAPPRRRAQEAMLGRFL